MRLISFHMVPPSIDTATTWNKCRFILSNSSDFDMIDHLALAVHAFARQILTPLSVDETLLSMKRDDVALCPPFTLLYFIYIWRHNIEVIKYFCLPCLWRYFIVAWNLCFDFCRHYLKFFCVNSPCLMSSGLLIRRILKCSFHFYIRFSWLVAFIFALEVLFPLLISFTV